MLHTKNCIRNVYPLNFPWPQTILWYIYTDSCHDKNLCFLKSTKSIRCTLRSGLHEIPTMLRTFPCGLEHNHACKWISDNIPGMLKYQLFLENGQKSICVHGCSPIHKERSLRVSNLGDKSFPYFQEEKGPFPVDWRTTMHGNGFLTIFQE